MAYSLNNNFDLNEISNANGIKLWIDDAAGNVCHMWVCDRYLKDNYYFDDCTGIEYKYLHMNWGIRDGEYNGWFTLDNFSPGGNNLNYNKKMICDIIPNL